MTLLEISQVLGNFGEFFGALAVVATLLYLAVQVRDTGKSAKFAAVQANRSERIAHLSRLRDSPYLPAITAKLASDQPLTVEEQSRLMVHQASTWALLYSEWVQRDLGIGEEYLPTDTVGMELAISSPASMQFWREMGNRTYAPRFVAYVEDKILESKDA